MEPQTECIFRAGVGCISARCLNVRCLKRGWSMYQGAGFREGTGHLLQIEKPQECIRLTLNFLARYSLA
jgi:hypothetical protein